MGKCCWLIVAVVGLSTQAWADPYLPAVQPGTITAAAITEDSGIAASRTNTGVLWTHNDSGDSARVFALSTTGTLLQTFNMSGATNNDFEDIAVGNGPTAGTNYLYVGDIGDNSANRSSIAVYRVPEPTVGTGTTTLSGISKITLQYPAADGPQNAETLMVDPSGNIYIVTKASGVGRVYEAAFPQSLSSTITLTHLSNIAVPLATGGDIAADGSKMIVRNGTTANEWVISPGQTIASAILSPPDSFALHSEQQGEGIGYSYVTDSHGPGFYTTSEGTNQPLYFYALAPEPGSAAAVGLVFALSCMMRPKSRREISSNLNRRNAQHEHVMCDIMA